MEALQAQSFCSQVILCDLPGTGVYYQEPGVMHIEEMVEHISENCQPALINAKPVVILGFSLGGMVALDYVTKFPDLFSEYILINSSVGGLSPFYRRLLPSALLIFFKVARAASLQEKERLILSLNSQLHQNDPKVLAEFVQIAETAPISIATQLKQILAGLWFKLPKDRLKKSGLVLYSKNDSLVDPSCSLALASYLSAPAIAHPKAGHDIAFDDPKWVIEQIASFLSSREENAHV